MRFHQLLLASTAFAIPLLAPRQAQLTSTVLFTVYDLPANAQPSTDWGTPVTSTYSAAAAAASTPSIVAGLQSANVAGAAPAVASSAIVSAVNSAEFGAAPSSATLNSVNSASDSPKVVYTTVTLDAAQMQALQTGTPLYSIVQGMENPAQSPVAGSTSLPSPAAAANAAAQTPAAQQLAASTFSTAAAASALASTTQVPAATTTPASGSGTYSGQGTYFEIGLGACGQTNTDQQLVCAVSAPLYDSSLTSSDPNMASLCGKQITVFSNGKSVTVTVVDRCEACAQDDLDLSPAAFAQLAPTSAGRIPITWSYT